MISVIDLTVAGTKVFGTVCDTASGAERFSGFCIPKSKVSGSIDADSVLVALQGVDSTMQALAEDE